MTMVTPTRCFSSTRMQWVSRKAFESITVYWPKKLIRKFFYHPQVYIAYCLQQCIPHIILSSFESFGVTKHGIHELLSLPILLQCRCINLNFIAVLQFFNSLIYTSAKLNFITTEFTLNRVRISIFVIIFCRNRFFNIIFTTYVSSCNDFKFLNSIYVSYLSSEYSTFMTAGAQGALTLRTIGGVIDLHFFSGPTPDDVTSQYTSVREIKSFILTPLRRTMSYGHTSILIVTSKLNTYRYINRNIVKYFTNWFKFKLEG